MRGPLEASAPHTCVYPDVPRQLARLLERLPAVRAGVCEAAPVDVPVVRPGAGHPGIPEGTGTSGFLSVSDSDRRVPAELGQESQASSCKGGVICISEVIDISPGNLDSSLCFFQPSVSHDVLCI